MNALDALRRMVDNYPGGRPAIALRLGKTDEVLRKELNGSPTHKLGLVDAVTIAQLCAEVESPNAQALAHCVAAESHGRFTSDLAVPHVVPASVVTGLSAHVHEAGQLVGAVLDSMTDGCVSDNELRSIERESADLVMTMQSLLESCRANNLAGKLVHLRRQPDIHP
jgi:hypothetical protein